MPRLEAAAQRHSHLFVTVSGRGGGPKIRARKIDLWRPPGVPFFLGVRQGTPRRGQTWIIREASFERVAPGRSEKTERDVPLEAGFTQQIALDGQNS